MDFYEELKAKMVFRFVIQYEYILYLYAKLIHFSLIQIQQKSIIIQN